MRPLSLRWRLMLAGGAAILLALGLATVGLALLFDRHVERVALADLGARADTLVAMVEPQQSGPPQLRDPPRDPLYDQPLSGHYWQMQLGERIVRSRSLWDHVLRDDSPPLHPGSERVLTLPDPRGQPLLALQRSLLVGPGADAVPLTLIVATERATLAEARRGFFTDLLPYVTALALLLLAAFWAQIVVGLRPLSRMAERVGDLVQGRRARIGGDLPAEVMPLAAQLDRMMDDRDREMERARHRAADLAHGFKTPLQALMGDAGQLRARGEDEIADSIETVSTAMQRLVDRELTRARIRSDRSAAATDPAPIVAKIASVLQRMPGGAALDWSLPPSPGPRARIEGEDLTEALGALMENAMRHAATRIAIRLVPEARDLAIIIRDDGPGIPQALLSRMMRRGERMDSSGEGQGIGLALVSDIAEAAGGSLTLENAQPGLNAVLRLPRAD